MILDKLKAFTACMDSPRTKDEQATWKKSTLTKVLRADYNNEMFAS